MRVSDALNIEDLRRQARRRLPRSVFEFVEGGVEDGLALARNRDAFGRLTIIPRAFRNVSALSLETYMLGRTWPSPFIAAPTGSAGLLWPDGEIALARACASHDIPYSSGNFALRSLEAVAAASDTPPWFQVYVWPERAMTDRLIDRARAADCEVLIVTVDTVASSNREYNVRNGFVHPYRVNRRNLPGLLMRPGWLWHVILRRAAKRGLPRFENIPADELERMRGSPSGFRLANDLCWDDLSRMRDKWRGKLVVKGLLHPDDAVEAAARGADGIVVSNHGGRTDDSFPASLEALPAIASAVNGRISVLFDGGIRRGSDVFKALALGADGVLLGRSLLYGVAAGGVAGAERALTILTSELTRTMAMAGTRDVSDISGEMVRSGGEPAAVVSNRPGR